MKPFIEIKKQRNIDTIVEDTFKFFRLHIKEMLRIVWQQNKILLTLLVIGYFLNTYYSVNLFSQFLQIQNGNLEAMNSQNTVLSSTISFAVLLLSFLFFPRFFAAIAGYMKIYAKNNGKVNEDEVLQIVKDKFWGLIGLAFSLGFMLFLLIIFISLISTGLAQLGAAGIFLVIALVIPLILYAIVYLSLVFYVYFFDNTDIGTAITRTATYIKQNFWFSFGVILVISIIIMLISGAINIPIYIYMLIKGMALFSKTSPDLGQSGDVFIALYSIISYLAQLILRVLMMISMVFLFYSLKEYHTNESMFEKIDQIGNDEENMEK